MFSNSTEVAVISESGADGGPDDVSPGLLFTFRLPTVALSYQKEYIEHAGYLQ